MHRVLFALVGVAAALVLLPGADAEEFWAVGLPNYYSLDATVALGNAGPAPATVTEEHITAGVTVSSTIPVAPGGVGYFTMPLPLSGTQITTDGVHRFLAPPGVTAELFDPLPDVKSNSATGLIDVDLLGTAYDLVVYEPFFAAPGLQGFFTVIATEPATTVTVVPSVVTEPGGTVPAMAAGSTHTFTLPMFAALNVESTGDLTGTRVTSDKPVAVFAGIRCAVMGSSACDHMAEQLHPVTHFGTQYVLCASGPSRPGATYSDLVRVKSLAPTSVTVTVTPPSTSGALFTIPASSWVDFPIATDTVVSSNQPVMVAQYYQDSIPGGAIGDPAMVVHSPVSGHGPSHQFLVQGPWTTQVSIAAATGSMVSVDGVATIVTAIIPGTIYGCQHIVPPSPGLHVTNGASHSVKVLGVTPWSAIWSEATPVTLASPPCLLPVCPDDPPICIPFLECPVPDPGCPPETTGVPPACIRDDCLPPEGSPDCVPAFRHASAASYDACWPAPGGELLVSHGLDDSGAVTRQAACYIPGTATWVALPDALVSRSHAAATSRNGVYHVVGGQGCASTVPPLGTPCNAFESFVMGMPGGWAMGPPMPQAVSAPAAIAIQDKMYVFGGRSCDQVGLCDPVSTLQIYDFATGSWSSGPAMPRARSDLSAARDGCLIHVVGGWGIGGVDLASVDTYDACLGAWTSTLVPDMPTPMRGTVAAVGGGLCVVGGVTGVGPSTLVVPTFHRYDFAAATWSSFGGPPARAYLAGTDVARGLGLYLVNEPNDPLLFHQPC